MNTDMNIKAGDGSGTFSAFVSQPGGGAPAPAVIVIQEIFGVNKNLRDICAKLSQKGYMAVCPDLFWRQEPGIQLTDQSEAEWQRAFQLFQGFNVDKGIDDLKATLDAVRKSKDCNGKTGTLGYCLGGKLAYLMATRSAADCNVSYYGVGIEELLGEAGAIKRPLLMHIAEQDKYVPPAAQARIKQALENNPHVEIQSYPDVDHAFTRIGGQHYNEKVAHWANACTADFLATRLT